MITPSQPILPWDTVRVVGTIDGAPVYMTVQEFDELRRNLNAPDEMLAALKDLYALAEENLSAAWAEGPISRARAVIIATTGNARI